MHAETAKREMIIRIAEIAIEALKLEDITPENFDPELDLVDKLGIDSMDLTTVVFILQDEYQIEIDEDDFPKLTSLSRIAEYVRDKLSAKKLA